MSAIGKLLLSMVAATIISWGVYNSFQVFNLNEIVGFAYAAEVGAFFVGFFSLVLIYLLFMKLKNQL